MLAEKYLYDIYFKRIRSKYTKRALSEKTIVKRMHDLLESMNEVDRHYLSLLGMYQSTYRVASMAEVSYKKAAHRISVAVEHMMTPRNVVKVIGINIFDNKGESLGASLQLSTRTIRALSRSGIKTYLDLWKWIDIGLVNIYRVPGVGKWGVIEILHLMMSEVEEHYKMP